MNKMYVFTNESDEDADIAIVFADSFTEAMEIYGKERSEDYAAQSIYYYGLFEDPDLSDPESCTPEYAKKNLDRHNKSWQICSKEPLSVNKYDETITIESRVYKGDYYNRITVTELPVEKYQVVSHIIFAGRDKILDRVKIMEDAAEELKRIQSIDVERGMEIEKFKHTMQKESWQINDFMEWRKKLRNEILNLSPDSEAYKLANKKYEDIKEKINQLLCDNDEMLNNFKNIK